MGAYTFENKLPFSVRAMTPNPLREIEDYRENNRSHVVYPGGMVVEGPWIHVAWGKGDKGIYITTFDKEKLLSSLKPVSFLERFVPKQPEESVPVGVGLPLLFAPPASFN